MDFIYRLQGISRTTDAIQVHFHNAQGDLDFTAAALKVDGMVGLDDADTPIFGEDFNFVKSVATTGTPKLTIPSPSMVHYRGGRAALDPAVYPDEDEFWRDLSAGQAGPGDRDPGLHLPAARRHEPRLPQRPGAAGRNDRSGPRRRAPARALHQADQRRVR